KHYEEFCGIQFSGREFCSHEIRSLVSADNGCCIVPSWVILRNIEAYHRTALRHPQPFWQNDTNILEALSILLPLQAKAKMMYDSQRSKTRVPACTVAMHL